MQLITSTFTNNPTAAIADTTTHEIGHQFYLGSVDANHPIGVWCNAGTGTDYCVMSYERNREDQYTEFCVDAPSHNYEVRDTNDGL